VYRTIRAPGLYTIGWIDCINTYLKSVRAGARNALELHQASPKLFLTSSTPFSRAELVCVPNAPMGRFIDAVALTRIPT